jgi:hypothetical protein
VFFPLTRLRLPTGRPAKERTCRERLEQLEKAGYITSQAVQGNQPGASLVVFHLTNKGRRWATGPEGPGLDRSIVFETAGKADEIIHQVRTNDVYFALSKMEQATWRIGDTLEIERGVFQGGGISIPDASYVSDDGGEVLVETDCGSYTAAQIRGKRQTGHTLNQPRPGVIITPKARIGGYLF